MMMMVKKSEPVALMYVKPTDVVTTIGSTSVAWRLVPARKRYDPIDGRSYDVRTALFGIGYNNRYTGVPTTLCAWRDVTTTGPLTQYSTVSVKLPEASWPNVCLGGVAARMIEHGVLDPVDAFWMTGSFHAMKLPVNVGFNAHRREALLTDLHQIAERDLRRDLLTHEVDEEEEYD